MDFWSVIEATRNILAEPSQYKVHGISRVRIDEGVGAMIQKAAMDWLSDAFAFEGTRPDEVLKKIENDPDKYHESWVKFAEKIFGIESVEAQETGWEMIVGGIWSGNNSLVYLPGGDRFY